MKNTFLFKSIILLLVCLYQPVWAQSELPLGSSVELSQLAPVNINTADAEELSSVLSGIGSSRAMAIVAYREQYGEFKSVDDLTNVRGVGAKTLDENRHLLTLGSD